jgi:hypothetical protein
MNFDDIDSFVDNLFAEQPLELSENELYGGEYDEPQAEDYRGQLAWQPAPPRTLESGAAGRYGWEDDLDGLAFLAGYPPEETSEPAWPVADRDGIVRLPQEMVQPLTAGEVVAWGVFLFIVLGVIVGLSQAGVI